jgi:hypothetical protein
VLNKIIERLSGSELSKLLRKEAKDWEKTLPEEHRISGEVFFLLPGEKDINQREFPHRYALQNRFSSMQIPSKELWFNAFKEHREERRRSLKDDAHSFFKVDDAVTDTYLRDLAERFYKMCAQTSSLFQVTVVEQLEQQFEIIKNINVKLEKMDLKSIDDQTESIFSDMLFIIKTESGSSVIGCAVDNNGTILWMSVTGREIINIGRLFNQKIQLDFNILYSGSFCSLTKVNCRTKGAIFGPECEINENGKLLGGDSLIYFDYQGNIHNILITGIAATSMLELEGQEFYVTDQILAERDLETHPAINGPVFNTKYEVMGIMWAGLSKLVLIKPITNVFHALLQGRFDIQFRDNETIPINS